MRNPEVPKRIGSLLPTVKILFVLRDPIARVWSNYWHDYTSFSYELSCPAEQILFDHGDPKGVLSSSFYYANICSWREALPDACCKVLFFEDMVKGPREFWAELLGFLGLAENAGFGEALQREGRAMKALGVRSPFALGLLSWTQQSFQRSSKHLFNWLNRHPQLKAIVFAQGYRAPAMPKSLERRLKSHFRDDMLAFSNEFPRVKTLWSSFSGQ